MSAYRLATVDRVSSAPSLVAIWLLEDALATQVHGGRRVGYMAFGALPNVTIAGRGDPSQLWRWVSSGLVHMRGNPIHLIGNTVALLLVGWQIERLYGRLVVLGSVALGIAAGSLAWLSASSLGLVPQPEYTVGVSAGICALVGLMLAYGFRERHQLSKRRARSMQVKAGIGIVLMVLLGVMVQGLNNDAHAGGLVAGCLIGLRLPTSDRGLRPSLSSHTRSVFLAVLILAAAAILFAAQNLIMRLLLPA